MSVRAGGGGEVGVEAHPIVGEGVEEPADGLIGRTLPRAYMRHGAGHENDQRKTDKKAVYNRAAASGCYPDAVTRRLINY